MASAVHCQLNPQVRPFLPRVMAPKLAYRRGKREGGEEPVSKHQIRSGDGRWAGRRGVRRLNPRHETKIKVKNGDWKREMKKKKISEDSAILAELVHLKEPPTSMGPEPAMDYVRRAVWGMLYADDACIVS